MSNTILIMGEPGTGKSRSIKNLDEKETYLINVLNKPLPFKGSKTKYIAGEQGNYYSNDNARAIIETIRKINKERPDIKNVIIDDFQYIMGNEFMRRGMEKSYDKFTEIGMQGWYVIMECVNSIRDDLFFFIISHTDTDAQGKTKMKVIGKMLDDKISLDGIFTVILQSTVIDGQYKFLTQNNGLSIAKSPEDMFDKLIDNDLAYVKQRIGAYDYDTLPTL